MNFFRVPVLTRTRIVLAIGIAFVADALQVLLGPLGWTLVDEVIDVGTMVAMSFLLGFHPLFLPTFVLEFLPIVDMLPTWIACVVLVIFLRSKQPPAAPPRLPSPTKVIDV